MCWPTLPREAEDEAPRSRIGAKARSPRFDSAGGAGAGRLLCLRLRLLGQSLLDCVDRVLVGCRNDAREALFKPERLLPAKTRRDGPGHDRLDAGILDRIGRHLELFGAALRMDHAR